MFKYKKLIIGIVSAVSIFIITASLSVFIVFSVVSQKYSYDDELFNFAKENVATVYYAKDEFGVSRQIWSDRTFGGEEWVSLTEIPEVLKMGFIAAEDRKFYKHSGVDVKRTAYALLNQALHLKSSFGASTITQQVVKNIIGDNERSFKRKALEICRAIRLENNHSKDEILELYLNIVPMSCGIYGVSTASRLYFGKEPMDLTVAECATLIGVTNAPGLYDPITHPEASREKRDRVLFAMAECGVISKEDYRTAKSEELKITGVPKSEYNISSWFVETARADIISDLSKKYGINKGASKIMLQGAEVTLTVDTRVQELLEDFFENADNLPEACLHGLNFSFAVTDNSNGDLIAIIGGAGKKEGNYLLNFATASITPASTLKPIALYAPLLDMGFRPNSVFEDMPLYYKETNGMITAYPKNSPDGYDGDITLSDAIAYSKNTVAVSIYNILGKETIYTKLKEEYGFDTLVENDKNPSPLALGQLTKGVSLRKMTEAYGAFSNLGKIRNSRSYISVFSANGDLLISKEKEEKSVMKSETSRLMTEMLRNVVDIGTARGVTLKEIVDTAGKTGTSGGDRDRLFIGFTPYYTAGIWCGYTGSSSSVGNNYPSHIQIWDKLMKKIHEEILTFSEESLKNF